MQEKGIQPPSPDLTGRLGQVLGGEFSRFVSILANTYPRVRSYTPSINPASVSANSEDTQTLTVNGLTTADVVMVNKPSKTAGLSLTDAHVSAADTLSLTFRNHTGSPIDAGEEVYRVVAIRL